MTSKIPRYLWVYNTLKKQIEDFKFIAGDRLPSEPELEKQYNVSRTTIRKAVELLANQGYVHIQQGRGTKVLDFKTTQKLQYVTSFSETLREQGFEVVQNVLALETVKPPDSIAEMLSISGSEDMVKLTRLTLANEVPIAIMINYLFPGMVPDFEQNAREMESLYLLLETKYNIFIDAATDFISAATADSEIVSLLKIEKGAPLLIVRRISYRGGEPIEFAELHIIAERYEYSVHTKERPPKELKF